MSVCSAVVTALLPALLRLLEGIDGPAREAAIDSLASEAISMQALADALGTAEWRGRQAIVEAATRRGEESVPFLCQAAEFSERRDVKRRAILALGDIGGSRCQDSLIAILPRTAETDVAIWAIGALAALPLQTTVATYLADPNANVRRQAVVAIGRLGQEGDPALVVPLLDDAHHSVRFAAAEALGEMGASAGAAVRRGFESMTAQGRYAALMALGGVGDPPSTSFLIEMACGEDPALAVSAALALEETSGAIDVALLERCLERASQAVEAGPVGVRTAVARRLRSAIQRARSRATED